MKKVFIAIAAVLLPLALNADGVNDDKPIKQSKIVYLYPEGQAAGKGIVENGVEITLGPGEDNGKHGLETVKPVGMVYDIGDSARMEFYFPENPNGLMIINCPGGAYWFVAEVNEGYCTVEFLLSQGISVCNMFYRLPYGHKTVPLTDVQNAFRYCRYHAAEWGIDKIGVMGFSAGGHLAASASTLFVDDITRPDFSVLIYPVITMEPGVTHQGSKENLIGHKWTAEDEEWYSLHKRVSNRTPVTFLGLSGDDTAVPIQNSIDYYYALRQHGITATMHIYPGGGHGWGFNHPPYRRGDGLGSYRDTFKADLAKFLKDQIVR